MLISARAHTFIRHGIIIIWYVNVIYKKKTECEHTSDHAMNGFRWTKKKQRINYTG